MKCARFGLRVLAVVVAVLFAAFSAAAQTLHLPPREKVVLKNGLSALLLEKHGEPLLNVYALVKTGSAGDPRGEDCVEPVTARLLGKGTKMRTPQQFAAN